MKHFLVKEMFCILTAAWFTSAFIMCLNNDYARQRSIYIAATSCIIHKEADEFLYQIRVFWLCDCSSSLYLGVFYRCSREGWCWFTPGLNQSEWAGQGQKAETGGKTETWTCVVMEASPDCVSKQKRVTCRRVLRLFSRVNIHVKIVVWLVWQSERLLHWSVWPLPSLM